MVQFLEVVSVILGWIYTLAWSLSFYGQPTLNFRRKSTSGTTVDFPFLNTVGFAAYFVSTALFYWSPVVRAQYAERYHGLTPTVTFNDVIFALHGTCLCVITASQYLFASAWGFERSPGSQPSRIIVLTAAGCVAVVAASMSTAVTSPASWPWLDVVYTLSYVKLLVTLVKYAPQVLANARNRSTKGWSISQILLDFLGGVLSIAQQSIDSYLQRDWSGITGNPVKFTLGNVSMFYDVLFIAQHYFLYNDGLDPTKSGERDALLESGERGERRLD